MKEHFDEFFSDYPNIRRQGSQRPVYVYDENWNYIGMCKTTSDCADFFDKDDSYITSLCYRKTRTRRDGYWYRLSRKIIHKEVDV